MTAITDEMVEAALKTYHWPNGIGANREVMRCALEAGPRSLPPNELPLPQVAVASLCTRKLICLVMRSMNLTISATNLRLA